MGLFKGITAAIPGASFSRLLIAGLLLGMSVVAIIPAFTGAVFTSNSNVGANTFSTGSVNISTSPTSAVVSFSSGMAPGDKVTAPITVTNGGTLQMRYAVKSTTTENTLAGQLSMTIKTGVTTCSSAGFGTDGTVVYGPAVLGTVAGTNVIGDPTQGANTGDRTLNASASEVLCIQVSLPLSSGNSFQSLSTTATLDFSAEQTANN
ncbi:MAG TPA: TasA family protein [Dehalococcoidia bacterium]|nr:TasA family protein [Dehalococcoidia bacterium]